MFFIYFPFVNLYPFLFFPIFLFKYFCNAVLVSDIQQQWAFNLPQGHKEWAKESKLVKQRDVRASGICEDVNDFMKHIWSSCFNWSRKNSGRRTWTLLLKSSNIWTVCSNSPWELHMRLETRDPGWWDTQHLFWTPYTTLPIRSKQYKAAND